MVQPWHILSGMKDLGCSQCFSRPAQKQNLPCISLYVKRYMCPRRCIWEPAAAAIGAIFEPNESTVARLFLWSWEISGKWESKEQRSLDRCFIPSGWTLSWFCLHREYDQSSWIALLHSFINIIFIGERWKRFIECKILVGVGRKS